MATANTGMLVESEPNIAAPFQHTRRALSVARAERSGHSAISATMRHARANHDAKTQGR